MNLTIATCFGGYESDYLQWWAGSLRDLYICCEEPPEVLWLDNASSPAFHAQLLDASTWIPGYVRVLDEALVVANPGELLPLRDRWDAAIAADFTSRRDIQVSLMYQRIRNDLLDRYGPGNDRWVLLLESDVLPPPDAAWRLIQAMERANPVGALCANIPYDTDRIRPMAWRMPAKRDNGPFAPEPPVDPVLWHESPEGAFDGMEIVDGIPMGCTLVRLSTLAALPIQPTWPPARGYGFDQKFCLDLRRELGLQCAIHWGVRAGHIKRVGGVYKDLRDVLV